MRWNGDLDLYVAILTGFKYQHLRLENDIVGLDLRPVLANQIRAKELDLCQMLVFVDQRDSGLSGFAWRDRPGWGH
jgi:hypothetical protein